MISRSKRLMGIQKVSHSPRGRGLANKITKCYIEGRGSKPKNDAIPSKIYFFKNYILIDKRVLITLFFDLFM